jgi:hypothetical protein
MIGCSCFKKPAKENGDEKTSFLHRFEFESALCRLVTLRENKLFFRSVPFQIENRINHHIGEKNGRL